MPLLCFEIDPRFGQVGQKMVCLAFFIESALEQLGL
jgi:hypothetical protein